MLTGDCDGSRLLQPDFCPLHRRSNCKGPGAVIVGEQVMGFNTAHRYHWELLSGVQLYSPTVHSDSRGKVSFWVEENVYPEKNICFLPTSLRHKLLDPGLGRVGLRYVGGEGGSKRKLFFLWDQRVNVFWDPRQWDALDPWLISLNVQQHYQEGKIRKLMRNIFW